MSEANNLIQIGSVETPDGLDNVQGYRVYLTNGIALSIRANGGGLDKGVGLYLIVNENIFRNFNSTNR